jgi:hypothetical protein
MKSPENDFNTATPYLFASLMQFSGNQNYGVSTVRYVHVTKRMHWLRDHVHCRLWNLKYKMYKLYWHLSQKIAVLSSYLLLSLPMWFWQGLRHLVSEFFFLFQNNRQWISPENKQHWIWPARLPGYPNGNNPVPISFINFKHKSMNT